GIVLDMTGLNGVVRVEKGNVRALAGTTLADIDAVTRPQGWELRLHPSTRSTATIAGFIAAGSGGMGRRMSGVLRVLVDTTEWGVISGEAEPRLLELRGRDIDLVHHAYGTNAIILEAEMPLAPAWDWRECIVALPDFMCAARFGVQLAHETGIIK